VPIAHPDSIEDLKEILRADTSIVLLAGGTDFMVGLNHGSTRLESDHLIVDLRSVAELSTVELDYRSKMLRLGAGVRWNDLLSGPIEDAAPCLSQSARTVGSHQIRTAGTIGGNVATASPAGDGVCALVALDASVVLTSHRGQRNVAVRDFATGPKTTVIEKDEFIERIDVPIVNGWQGYSKIGTRNAMVISVAGAAVVLSPDSQICRIALGSVGPTIIEADSASSFATTAIDWNTSSVSTDDLDQVVQLVRESASPINDHRSTASYRTHAVGVLVKRLIEQGLRSIKESV
jgi:CO/xanthine dehydrogenase FAD-binding subunit